MGKTLIPDDFKVTDEMRLWARLKVPNVNVEAQYELFCDYWRAHGKKMMDWQATFRNWLRRAPEFTRAPVNQYSNFERRQSVTRAASEPTRIAPAANRFDNTPRFPDSRYRKQ